MWKYIFYINSWIIGLLAYCGTVSAQKKDSTTNIGIKNTTQKDSTKTDWKPKSVRVGVDILGLAQPIWSKKVQQSWSVNADVAWRKYLFLADVSILKNYEAGKSIYESNAFVWKIGVGYNFVHKILPKEAIFFGIQYANSKMTEKITSTTQNPLFGVQDIDATNSFSVRWLELQIGLKINIWKKMYSGYVARYKFAGNAAGTENFKTYNLLGFGTPAKSNFGFEYYVGIRF